MLTYGITIGKYFYIKSLTPNDVNNIHKKIYKEKKLANKLNRRKIFSKIKRYTIDEYHFIIKNNLIVKFHNIINTKPTTKIRAKNVKIKKKYEINYVHNNYIENLYISAYLLDYFIKKKTTFKNLKTVKLYNYSSSYYDLKKSLEEQNIIIKF